MKTLVFLSGAKHLMKNFKGAGENEIRIFPDGEFDLKFSKNVNVKGKNVYLVQSFYRDKSFSINDRVFEALSSYYNAKSLGAKRVYLIAPYFPYMRQDMRFRENQVITSKVMAELCSVFSKVYIFEPHLHRFKKFSEFFPNAKRVSLNEFILPEIRKIKKRYKRILVIGPDEESSAWVKPIKEKLGIDYITMSKKRLSPKDVEMHINKSYIVDSVIIIDDMISTGRTMLKCLDNVISKQTYVFAFHGLFTDKRALEKLKRRAKVYVSNSLPVHGDGLKVIDVSGKIKEIVGG